MRRKDSVEGNQTRMVSADASTMCCIVLTSTFKELGLDRSAS